MTDLRYLTQLDAADALLQCVYSGTLGSTNGMIVGYALMKTTDDTFVYSASLEPLVDQPGPIDRYKIEINRHNGNASTPTLIEIRLEEMRKAIFAATGETMASFHRFIDGGLSISYKITTIEKPNNAYVVQLRHHGHVASMDALMKFVRVNTDTGVVPLPAVYSIPGEAEHQPVTGFGTQITDFVPGAMAESVYPDMPHADKLQFVRKMAQAWEACWELPLNSPHQIGELIAIDCNGNIDISVGPDRHYSLGGPFVSVRDWLRARLNCAVESLERATGIDDYKEIYLDPIREFVESGLDQIPKTVDDCPIVALHVDMGLHNVIVSTTDHTDIKAIIDWEFCASGPFLAAYNCIDMLFRRKAPDGFRSDYQQSDELREAFWNAIPKWKTEKDSEHGKDFLEWFQFANSMQPEYCSRELPKAEKMKFWAENIRIVEEMLKKNGRRAK